MAFNADAASRLRTLLQRRKARPPQTEQPNALPTSWRCPGEPGKDVGGCLTPFLPGRTSVMAATVPTMSPVKLEEWGAQSDPQNGLRGPRARERRYLQFPPPCQHRPARPFVRPGGRAIWTAVASEARHRLGSITSGSRENPKAPTPRRAKARSPLRSAGALQNDFVTGPGLNIPPRIPTLPTRPWSARLSSRIAESPA